ncbi:S-adenosyl-L-methionine-dependent methyltransferase [Poronia punctata]|nr:S-adenosyl-L-methionine-dependent methyltransferase [Poronia punctata]
MFTVRNYGRALYSPLLGRWRCFPSGSRCHHLHASNLVAEGQTAERLKATDVWRARYTPVGETIKESADADADAPDDEKPKGKGKGKAKTKTKTPRPKRPKILGDKTRVNLVGEKLCDDIFSYIGPSLDRHRGCDIIDIYPGAGLWSRKLHDYLQPRSHLLLEPDAKLYEPFLQPLLDRPGTTLVPKSGIIWRELNSVLNPEYLPHQTPRETEEDLIRRNDTLLVTANLIFHPKKSFAQFDSVTDLVLHQFVDAIRSSSLFYRYGQVRVLVWTRVDDKQTFLPKCLHIRRKQAVMNELSCEWIHEVCGSDSSYPSRFVRDDAIDRYSLMETIKRMKASNIQMPPGRAPPDFEAAMEDFNANRPIPALGTTMPTTKRPYMDTLAELQANKEAEDLESEDDEVTSAKKKLMEKRLRYRKNSDLVKAKILFGFYQELENMIALHEAGDTPVEAIKARAAEWAQRLKDTHEQIQADFTIYNDSLHAIRQDPPVLQWDRRQYEPMEVRAEEFFPNIQGTLLDIQAKPPHPLLRRGVPGANEASDMFDVILSTLTSFRATPVRELLDSVWPGAADYIISRWTSVNEAPRARGGFPNFLPVEPSARSLNERQYEELLELWMDWPFRPEFHDLVGRHSPDDNYSDTVTTD